MAIQNKTQTKVSITGLTYNSLLEDVYNALKDSEFKDEFTDFNSSTAERMLAELFCYIAQQLSNRMDQMGNELFVDTASIEGLSRLLKVVGYKLDFPAAAHLTVDVSTSSSNGDTFVFSPSIDPGPSYSQLVPSNEAFKYISLEANSNIKFEFVYFDELTNSYDYTHSLSFTTPYQEFELYNGQTKFQTYTVRSTKKDVINLNEYPVIKNSVEIYYKEKAIQPDGTYAPVKFLKVDNFFSREALTCEDTGYFTVNNTGNGACEIVIQPNANDMEKELIIMYRVGGGSQGNISIGALNNTELRKVEGYVGTISFYNTTSGKGGADELTADEIRNNVSQEIRSSKIAITEEDYEYLLPKLDPAISYVKCYGEKNEDSRLLSKTYGYYVNPLNVWLMILKYSKSISDEYNTDLVSELTDYINDIVFQTFDLTQRFNERYSVNNGILNEEFLDLPSAIENNMVVTYQLSNDAVKALLKGNNKITLTSSPYIETRDPLNRSYLSFEEYSASSYKGTVDYIKQNTWLPEASAELAGAVYAVSKEPYTGGVYSRYICVDNGDDTYSWEPAGEEHYQEDVPVVDYIKPHRLSGSFLPTPTADNVGDVYTVTKQAHNNELNTRFICVDNGDNTYSWEPVSLDYYYSNFTTVAGKPYDDVKYIQQDTSASDKTYYLYSMVDRAFTGSFEDGTVDIEGGTTLTINGKTTIFPAGTYTSEQLSTYINSNLLPKTNEVILKDNIPGSVSDIYYQIVNQDMSDDSTLYFTQNGVTSILKQSDSTFTKGLGAEIRYADLIAGINLALENAGISDARAFLLTSVNNCCKLVIVSKGEFSVTEEATELTAEHAFLTNYLGNENTTSSPLVFDSELVDIPTDNAELYDFEADYTGTFITYEGNDLVIKFEEGMDSTTLESNSAAFINYFKVSGAANTPYTSSNRRTFAITLNTDAEEATLSLTKYNIDNVVEDPLYVNIFGDVVTSIRLGTFYSDIKNNLPELSAGTANLLKRNGLSKLYSTKYITNDAGEDEEDIYGSEYQLKFTSRKLTKETFNEIDNGTQYAVISFQRSTTSLLEFPTNSYLYLKVDTEAFTTPIVYTFYDDFGIEHTTTIEVGDDNYARFNLNDFNTTKTSILAMALATAYPSSLLSYANEDGVLVLQTTSYDYASSIDFGKTDYTILKYLFGLSNKKVITSDIGTIFLKQIEYFRLAMIASSYAYNNTILFSVKGINSEGNSYELIDIPVDTGSTINDLRNNLLNSPLAEYIVINNDRIIFTDRNDGSSVEIKLEYVSQAEEFAWRNMFALSYGQAWEEITIEGKNYLRLYKENEGDYYISVVEPDEYGNKYMLNITRNYSFPYGFIYVHMFEDYSFDHVVSEDIENSKIYNTDEYVWNSLLKNKKVMLTNHVYEQPKFIPFDLNIVINIPNTLNNQQEEYKTKIRNFLREYFGVYAKNVGKSLYREDIIIAIRENFPEVRKVTINYFGPNMEEPLTDTGYMEIEFNQKLILASNKQKYAISSVNGEAKAVSATIHGLVINVGYSTLY